MKKLLIAAAVALTTIFAVPAFADPSGGPLSYIDTVGRNSTWSLWVDVEGGSTTVIDLEGDCGYAQDIDLWVYDIHNNEIARSTSNSCSESIVLDHYGDDTVKVIVENVNKPHATDFYLDIY